VATDKKEDLRTRPDIEEVRERVPKEMAFRPSQIRASAAEAALMMANAFAARAHYCQMKMAGAIVAGEEDRLVDIDQSGRLHAELPQSAIHRVAGAGHMVHQEAPDVVLAAIHEVALDGHNRGKVLPLVA
jgi:pimeloyl-ACP methyl ester carboxylesterase